MQTEYKYTLALYVQKCIIIIIVCSWTWIQSPATEMHNNILHNGSRDVAWLRSEMVDRATLEFNYEGSAWLWVVLMSHISYFWRCPGRGGHFLYGILSVNLLPNKTDRGEQIVWCIVYILKLCLGLPWNSVWVI